MFNKKANEFAKNFYMCFLVVYMLVREVMPLQFLINNIVVSVFVFLAGFSLIVWDLVTDRNCLKGKAIDSFAAFMVICVLSSILNYKYGIGSNIKCIAAMVLEYFLFFSIPSHENKGKTLKNILNTLIITMSVFVLASVLMYVFSIDYSIASTTGSGDQGFDATWGRLWGVFGDPNVACYISLVSVFASAYFMYTYKKVIAYILYGLNILLQLIFITLTASRSGLLLLLLIPVISSIYFFLCHIKTDKKRAFGSVAVTVAVSLVLFGGYYGLNYSIPYVKAAVLNTASDSAKDNIASAYRHFYQNCGVEILEIAENQNNTAPDGKAEVEEIVRKDDKEDYSNGRFERWKAGFEVFKTTPVFGASPRNAVAIAKERTPDTVMGKYGWVTHCAYLEVLVNSGILGFIAMFSALIYIAVVFLKAAVKKGFDSETYISFLCFITIAAGAFFVSDVFFIFSINSLLFFYLLGYVYNGARTEENGWLYKVFSFLIKEKRV